MKALFIDAGHGLGPGGAPDGGVSGNGTTEREQVVLLARELIEQLKGYPLQVIGIGVDEALSVADKTASINSICQQNGFVRSDALLVSLHLNSGDSSARGVEGWVSDAKGDWDRAATIVTAVADASGMTKRNPLVLPSSQNRYGRLGILDDTIPEAVLIECGFLTNAYDSATILQHRAAIVFGLHCGICLALGFPRPTPDFFTDVPFGSWFEGPVRSCLSAGLLTMPEDALFHPDRPMTRAEAAAIFSRLLSRLPH